MDAYLVSWKRKGSGHGRFTPWRLFDSEAAALSWASVAEKVGSDCRILRMEIESAMAEGETASGPREGGRVYGSEVGESDADPGNYGERLEDDQADYPPSRSIRIVGKPAWSPQPSRGGIRRIAKFSLGGAPRR